MKLPEQRGITLTELLVVLGVVSTLLTLALPTHRRALQAAAIDRLAADGEQLFSAVVRYQADHGHPPWPGTSTPDGLNLRTLSPLSTGGYLGGTPALLGALKDDRLTAYDTPGLPSREGFWMILTDRQQPDVQLVVASTDAFPLAPETSLEGVYLLRGSAVEKLQSLNATVDAHE